jgi:ferredoxin/flavodoxin---NADP+ reductase
MPTIMDKRTLAPSVYRLEIDAPLIARRRKPGQFIILRVNEFSERIPLTIVDSDPVAGTITLIYQAMGEGTRLIESLEMGDVIRDVAGPLGHGTDLSFVGTTVCIGGGIGVAPLYPIARGLSEHSNTVISIVGARNKDLLILEDDMKAISDELIITTDDGSYGVHGFVTDALREKLEAGLRPGLVVTIGPVRMMWAVSELTREYGIKTIVSLNPIMVDGTGMCGGCRVNIGNDRKFACVDGPEFDAHQVNFEELMNRQRMYIDQESCGIKRIL